MNILDLLSQDGIKPKRMASTHGGEYASPCPLCGGRDRFRCWPEEGKAGNGLYWCRGCDTHGDVIQYLRDVRGMSFYDACSFLDVEPNSYKVSFDWGKPARPVWEPKEIINPKDAWVKNCSSFVDRANMYLVNSDGPLDFFRNKRGLSLETIKAFSLGWNHKDLWRDRASWGLPDEFRPDGKRKKLWLPEGAIIPYFLDGILQRVRVRRKDGEEPRYYITPGSTMAPMVIGDNRRIFIIVESELDAILIHQEIGDMATVIALGNAQTRPDKRTADLLQGAELIFNSLDSDEAGIKESYQWWPQHFQQSRRLPPIDGKDIGEMWLSGITLQEWVKCGIKKYTEK